MISNRKNKHSEIKYAIFRTTLGWMGIAATAKGLLALILPKRTKKEVMTELKEELGEKFPSVKLVQDKKMFAGYIKDITDYFNSGRVDFNYKLDLTIFTSFQRQVYSVARTIPYGVTSSYSWIAQKVGEPGAKRAVGQALKKNMLPIIIPCHRVIKSDNLLCGFAGGVEWKAKLLAIEGVILA
jgi:methylated-DNA-[protein]-cysteine S-methyltransferase